MTAAFSRSSKAGPTKWRRARVECLAPWTGIGDVKEIPGALTLRAEYQQASTKCSTIRSYFGPCVVWGGVTLGKSRLAVRRINNLQRCLYSGNYQAAHPEAGRFNQTSPLLGTARAAPAPSHVTGFQMNFARQLPVTICLLAARPARNRRSARPRRGDWLASRNPSRSVPTGS